MAPLPTREGLIHRRSEGQKLRTENDPKKHTENDPKNTPKNRPKTTPKTPLQRTQNLIQPDLLRDQNGPALRDQNGIALRDRYCFSIKKGGRGPKWSRIAGPKWDRFLTSFSSIWGVYFGPFFVLIFILFGYPFWLRYWASASSFWVSILLLCFVLIFLILRVWPCSWSLRREARRGVVWRHVLHPEAHFPALLSAVAAQLLWICWN